MMKEVRLIKLKIPMIMNVKTLEDSKRFRK